MIARQFSRSVSAANCHSPHPRTPRRFDAQRRVFKDNCTVCRRRYCASCFQKYSGLWLARQPHIAANNRLRFMREL